MLFNAKESNGNLLLFGGQNILLVGGCRTCDIDHPGCKESTRIQPLPWQAEPRDRSDFAHHSQPAFHQLRAQTLVKGLWRLSAVIDLEKIAKLAAERTERGSPLKPGHDLFMPILNFFLTDIALIYEHRP
jgi:hypothetical protein